MLLHLRTQVIAHVSAKPDSQNLVTVHRCSAAKKKKRTICLQQKKKTVTSQFLRGSCAFSIVHYWCRSVILDGVAPVGGIV